MTRNTIISIALTLVCALVFSCREQDETYREFYNEANKYVYPQHVDNLKVKPGYYRAQLSFLKACDPSVTVSKIFWNNNRDSIIVDMKNPTYYVEDTIYVDVKNLNDDSYTFTIYSYDKNGNSSVPVDITTTVLGDTYVESLSNRSVKSAVAMTQSESVIKWSGKTNGLQYTVFRYKTNKGDYKEFNIPNDVTEIVLNDYELEHPENFQWKSVYFLNNCLDSLYGKWVTSAEPIQYDSDYEQVLVDGVDYLKFSNQSNRVSISTPDPENPYDFQITCTIAGSPWIMMESMEKDKQGDVLVFQYKAQTLVEKMILYWIPFGGALSTNNRSDLGVMTATTGDGWSVFKRNLGADMNKFGWTGEAGDNIRCDMWNMTVGQTIRIRNIHFREARANE